MKDKIPPKLKNKYVVAILVFFVWIMFFDRNNLINQIRLFSTLHSMKNQKEYYRNEIRTDSIAYYTLKNNKDALEKLAREKYLMKKDNEDVYVIIEK
jgi:cell division protein FtsB